MVFIDIKYVYDIKYVKLMLIKLWDNDWLINLKL